jgi:hypothetical protein
MPHWRVPVGRTSRKDRIIEIAFGGFAFGIAAALTTVLVVWRIVVRA